MEKGKVKGYINILIIFFMISCRMRSHCVYLNILSLKLLSHQFIIISTIHSYPIGYFPTWSHRVNRIIAHVLYFSNKHEGYNTHVTLLTDFCYLL